MHFTLEVKYRMRKGAQYVEGDVAGFSQLLPW
jgi:hypothetical protein